MVFGDDVAHGFRAASARMDAAFHAMLGFASRVGAPGMVVVGVMLADLLAGHALPFAEAAFAQTRVEFHVQPHEVGEGVRGLLRAEQIRRDDEHAAGRGGRVVDFVDVGQMGVEHALLPEKGIVTAGDCIIGADSHTCTYGAVGAFSTGVGSTDMAAGMAKGMAWFKVPAAIKVELKGQLHKPVTGKDVILHLIGEIGVSGALYKSLEFVGDGVKSLTMEDRLCICNMAIEAGAKNGIFPVDEITEAYLKGRSQRPWVKYEADPDAEYERSIVIDLDALEPTVSYPHLPENTHLAKEGKDIKIDQIVIGSCTNGRIEDMEAAYEILKGRHIAKGVRGIIIPATMAVYKECILRGYTEAFIDAGCIVSTPTCGPCLGGYMGILAAGERCVSTTNRNFVGRMGHVDSEVYLASPATAAASALTGYITDPREV